MSEFRLLGLVEMRSGGHRVALGQPRQRLVLTALLVDAGRPVTREVLVYRAWGDTSPDRARHAVHEYLTRIRRMLAGLGEDRDVELTRRGNAYMLEVDPERVDVLRFRRLLDQARDPACTDLERAGTLGRALELWRGEPLADLSGEWVQRVREGLRRQRLDAAVLWAEAQLRLGRPAEVIEPLAELAAENPLSEQVVAVLMRALHGTGRTVDALDWYTGIRKRLVEDLATEPGAELQAVHQAVLRGEPELAGGDVKAAFDAGPDVHRETARPDPVRVVPAQLPVAVRGFAGRDRELTSLDLALAEAHDDGGAVIICAVSGTAGIGKTALALHWAQRAADRFPDGQLYVNLRGFDPAGPALTAADAVRGFLDALGVPPQRIPAELGAQAALFRSLLAGRRVLVVLDNARDAAQVRPLLPGSPGCLVVVTSRSQLASLVVLDGATHILLDVLTTDESRLLLAQRLGATRIAAEPDAVDQIITRCARLPLALAVVAAQAAVNPGLSLMSLAHQLGEAHGRLDVLAGGDATSDVRAVFSWSYAALGSATARLFRLLGLHPGPDFTPAVAASLAGVPLAEALRLLAKLAEAHLLTEHLPGRYTCHDMLRAYAAEQAHRTDPDDERRAAVHRMLDHYLHTAHGADRLMYPARDQITIAAPVPGATPATPTDLEQALAWFTAEHQVLLAMVEQATATGFDTHTWQLAWVLMTHLYRRGHGDQYVATQRAAVTAATRLGDPATLARTHRSLANAYIMLGRLDEAQEQLQHALTWTVETDDPTSQAHTHHGLAYVRQAQGRYAEALEHSRQTLDLFRAAGHRIGQANALNNVGWLAARLGQDEDAITSCEEALVLHGEAGDNYGQAAAWDSLGYAHHNLGHHAEAVTCCERALELLHDLGDRYQEASILDRLGDIHRGTGDLVTARATYRRALAILDDLGHPDADGVRDKLRNDG